MSHKVSPFTRGGDSGDVKTMARPFRGTGFASHTKTLKIVGFCDFQLSPFPTIGKGFGKRFEAFLARKVGWSVKNLPSQEDNPMEVSVDDETSVGLEGELETSLLVWLDRRKGGFTFLVVDVKTRQRSEGT